MSTLGIGLLCVGAGYIYLVGLQVPRLSGVRQPQAAYMVGAFAVAFWPVLYLIGKVTGSVGPVFVGILPAMFVANVLQVFVPGLRKQGVQAGLGVALLLTGATLAMWFR